MDAGIVTKDDPVKLVTKRKMQLEIDRLLEQFEVCKLLF